MNANAESNLLVSLLPLVVLFAVFYFFLIRPQRVQAKRHKEMLESLKKAIKSCLLEVLFAKLSK